MCNIVHSFSWSLFNSNNFVVSAASAEVCALLSAIPVMEYSRESSLKAEPLEIVGVASLTGWIPSCHPTNCVKQLKGYAMMVPGKRLIACCFKTTL